MPTRIFISPTIAPAKCAAAKLFELLNPKLGACDFGGSFVISPTKNSARQIVREFMAMCESENACGVSGLEFASPQTFLEAALPRKARANIFESLGALKKIVERANPADYPDLFPSQDGAKINALSFAKSLMKLGALAAEAGFDFADISKIAEEKQIADSRKWRELAEIERLSRAELTRISKGASNDLLRECAKNPAADFAPRQVILVGVMDAPKIFFDLLKELEKRGTRVCAIIISDKAEMFDEYGLPTDGWREIQIPISDDAIFLCADQNDQAAKIANALSSSKIRPAIAAEDGESSRMISAELACVGLESRSPEGERFSEGDAFAFARAILDCFKGDDENANFALFRNHIFLKCISAACGIAPAEIRQAADRLLQEKICKSITRAYSETPEDKPEHAIFAEAKKLLEPLVSENSAQHIARIFKAAFGGLESHSPFFAQACESLKAALAELECALRAGFDFSEADALEIVLERADARFYSAILPEAQIPILNWLEIFWEPAERIIIADFNEGKVPEAVFGDAHLPDSLKRALGIRCSSTRHRRDACMAHTLASSRPAGNLIFFTPKKDFSGEPLRPSALLFQGIKKPAPRALKLFSEMPTVKKASAFSKAWNLKIVPPAQPEFLSATDFKAYIDCPFKFYLERMLKACAFDPQKAELDAMQIGNAVHDAFFKAAKIHSENPDEIYKALETEFEKSLFKLFGKKLPAAVMLQREGMLARLKAASLVEARHRAEGWRPAHLEEKFEPFKIGAFKIKARIDRIDVNDSGEMLVVDYKTSNKFDVRKDASAAEAAHLKPARGEIEDWRLCEGEKPRHWLDLQLPLYCHAANLKYAPQKISCAYFAMPSKPEDTSFEIWDISRAEIESALQCAENIAKKIEAHEFSPSKKSPFVKTYPEFFAWADAGNLKDFTEVQS